MQVTHLLVLLPLIFWFPLPPSSAEDPPKCTNISGSPIPKKYIHYMDRHRNVIVQTSSRPLHRLSTEIFKIYLEELIGFKKVDIVEHDADFDTEKVINGISPRSADSSVLMPKSMVDLEVWLPPGHDMSRLAPRLVEELGDVGPPGRFGWFIPVEFSSPVKKYYQAWDDHIEEVHWTFLKDGKAMEKFGVDDEDMEIVFKNMKHAKNHTKSGKEGDIYTPPQCLSSPCALLLTGSNTTLSFAVQHVLELKLKVKIAFLGSGLFDAVDQLGDHYRKNGKKDKGLLVLYYTPSEVILREKNFVKVIFPQCNYLNTTASLGCKYETNRIVKVAWEKVEGLGLLQHIRNFKFTEEDYDHLLYLYSLTYPRTIPELKATACRWMNDRNSAWVIDQSKKIIHIGGIFPLFDSTYNGFGIVRGAFLATTIINNDTSILKDYTLRLAVENGKCRTDSVMKIFIDYVTDSYYDNLLGVLGPACSDTVEPLAGVSKLYRTMVISYSAEGSSFSDREKYPYFYRTIGENMDFKHVYLRFFKKLGWKRVAALTEDGQKYTEYIAHMQEMLEKEDIVFVANTKFPRDRYTSHMARYLEDLKKKSARIIILDVVEPIARTVMCEAYHLKMTHREGYVWFLPTWLNETWYDTDYFNKYRGETSNCTTREMIKAATGYFSLAHAFYASNDTVVQGNMTVKEWIEKYNKIRPSLTLSNYAGYAYDAMWTYALALDKLAKTDPDAVSDLHSETTTPKLVKLIQQTDFMGVSGRIKFRGGPSRFSPIILRQWYGNATHMVGEFQPNVSDHRPEILGGTFTLFDDKLKWFTSDGKRPEDGTPAPPRCALDSLAKALGVSCEKAIIILNVVVICLLFVLVLAAMVVLKRRYDMKVKYTEKYMRHFGIDLRLNPAQITDLDKWEILRSSVVINRKLGEGAFGTVYGGETNFPDRGWVAVAVKTLKMGSSTEEKLDFLSEAEVMKRFEHKNIVKLLGVCTKEEPIYTIMEFMLYGDLKTFLLARRHLVSDKTVEESDEISCRKLTGMALDVARGLSYLASLKYVHRDVASRNCLINAQRVVKLGDFGMTRPMFESEYYKFTRKGMLPVRWMSPESLTLGVFTPASDVWSFGVLLYEIITFGSFPYQGMTNADVLEYVKNGHTITIPAGVKTQLRGLLKSCWHQDAKLRTRASEIVEFLANNPRLLVPCLEVPLASVQLEDSNQLEKITLPTLNGNAVQGDTSKEPLLGVSRSAGNLLNFGKYVSMSKSGVRGEEEDGDEDNAGYLVHNPGCSQNGYGMSRV